MKTLNKQITADFYISETGYADLRAVWTAAMNDREQRKQLTCTHHLVYLMLRGKDWRKGLTPITNKTKLDNGAALGWIGDRAVRSITADADLTIWTSPFRELLTSAAPSLLRARLQQYHWNDDILSMEPYVDTE